MHSKLKELYQSVNSLMTGSESNVIHIFGSLVYGLSTKDSDVDLYLEIGRIKIIIQLSNIMSNILKMSNAVCTTHFCSF